MILAFKGMVDVFDFTVDKIYCSYYIIELNSGDSILIKS